MRTKKREREEAQLCLANKSSSMSFDAASSLFSKWSNNIVFSLIKKKIASNFFEFFMSFARNNWTRARGYKLERDNPLEKNFKSKSLCFYQILLILFYIRTF